VHLERHRARRYSFHASIELIDLQAEILTREQDALAFVRHGTTTLFAALNLATGTVIGRCQRRHRHEEYLHFLKEIDANVPKGLAVHLIVDNYVTHKHPRVQRWLAAHPPRSGAFHADLCFLAEAS
jgi:hypothetical protein